MNRVKVLLLFGLMVLFISCSEKRIIQNYYPNSKTWVFDLYEKEPMTVYYSIANMDVDHHMSGRDIWFFYKRDAVLTLFSPVDSLELEECSNLIDSLQIELNPEEHEKFRSSILNVIKQNQEINSNF